MPDFSYHILFVCTGNICRSPMAEYFLRAQLPGDLVRHVLIQSAGTFDGSGYAPPEEVVEVMQEVGIDIRGHQSQTVTKDLIEQQDIIFALADEHVDTLQSAFPQDKIKIHLLGSFLKSGTTAGSIDDPFGHSLDYYKKIRDQIADEIQRILSELISRIEASI